MVVVVVVVVVVETGHGGGGGGRGGGGRCGFYSAFLYYEISEALITCVRQTVIYPSHQHSSYYCEV